MGHQAKPDEPRQGPSRMEKDDDPLQVLLDRISSLIALARHYLDVRADMLRLKVLKTVFLAALGVLGLLLVSALVIYGVVQIMQGTAGGLNAVFRTSGWPGTLVSGLFFLGLLFGGWCIVYAKARASFRDKLREKYEQRAVQPHDPANADRRADNGRPVRIRVAGAPGHPDQSGHDRHDHGP